MTKEKQAEVRLPVSSKESVERIIKDFKMLIGPELAEKVCFEICGTEVESMSGHKFTDWELVIRRKDVEL